MSRRRISIGVAGALVLALLAPGTAAATTAKTSLVSVNSAGEPADHDSYWPSMSADGTVVAFQSYARNLSPSGKAGIFIHGPGSTTTLVPSRGYQPAVSGDGRLVAFSEGDVYVYNPESGKTVLVSASLSGVSGRGSSASPSISADGRYVAFSSYSKKLTRPKPNPLRNEFVRDLKTGKTVQVNVNSKGKPGNGMCHHPSISANGRYVAFESNASNLVKGTRGWNVFVRDLRKHKTKLASVSTSGREANGKTANPWISGDGRYVVFESRAANLVKGDANKSYDIFRRDLKARKTIRVSVSSSGKGANADSRYPVISNHGGFIAFYSAASNLVSDDTNGAVDAFFHNVRSGKTVRIDVGSNGEQANAGDYGDAPPSMTADGRYVAFESPATNLVPSTSGNTEVFIRGPLHG